MKQTECVEMSEQTYESLRLFRPKTAKQLKHYLKVFLDYSVPDQVLCDGHASPMDYLWHAYSCDIVTPASSRQLNQKSRQDSDGTDPEIGRASCRERG